jgi:hypothetical protein
MKACLCLVFAILSSASLSCGSVQAAPATTLYFWLVPFPYVQHAPKESFVIAVDAASATQIHDILNNGHRPGFEGQIASGSVDYNKNYHAPGHPVWNWHVASITKIFDFSDTFFPACVCPYLIANPSDIAADPNEWITRNGDGYTPINYYIAGEIDPSQSSHVANVSSRSFTGQGERTPITGFIINGGEPHNVIVRGIGPSLAPSGVEQPATNPKIDLYQGSTHLFQNTDWRRDSSASIIINSYPSLAPSNDKEAALYLTLLPGAYTVLTSNEDAGDGVVLTEVYDVTNSP